MWRNILIHLCVVTYRFLFNFLVRSATNTKNPSQLRQTQPRTVNSNHSVGSGDSGKVEELKQQVNLEYNLLPHWRCMVYRGSGNTEIFYLSTGKLSEKSYLSVQNPTCPVFCINIWYLQTQLCLKKIIISIKFILINLGNGCIHQTSHVFSFSCVFTLCKCLVPVVGSIHSVHDFVNKH
jgi:hypothetical protein